MVGLVLRHHVPDQVRANDVAEVEVADPEVKVEIGADVGEGLDHRVTGRKVNVTKRKSERRSGKEKRKDCLPLRRIVSVVCQTLFILSVYCPAFKQGSMYLNGMGIPKKTYLEVDFKFLQPSF